MHTSLAIRVSDVRARDLDDAEGKPLPLFGEHEHELAAWVRRSKERAALSVLPLPDLESDFFLPEFSSGPYTPTRIVSVPRPDGGWELILENQGKAKVVLNDKFEIIGTARLE